MARLLRSGQGDTRPTARPGCEFGLLVEERLKDLSDDMDAVKSLLRWLLTAAIAGLIGLVVDVVMRGLL